MIGNFQDAYFDFPILKDSEEIPVEIKTSFFILNSTSKTTLIYDIVVFLLDSQNPVIEQILALNFDLYDTMLRILRPDGRYNQKIN